VEHTTESTERDISWLDRLIEAERARAAHLAAGPVPAEQAEGPGWERTETTSSTENASNGTPR
jgi:hypothetical protein